jgi:hypothetical protein
MPQFAERTHAHERRRAPVASRGTHVDAQKSHAIARPHEGIRSSSGVRSPVSEVVGGLPTRLRTGVEALSGIAMDDVRVHRNSSEPAKLGALAFTRGAEIHLGPSQDQHLPHEAWHVVQQKQGRVSATTQMKGHALNDDARLEREADRMGAMATDSRAMTIPVGQPFPPVSSTVVQRQPKNPVGERAAAVAEAEAELNVTTADLEAQSDAEDALKLQWRRRKEKGYAWAVGRKDKARLQKDWKLPPKFQQEITVKVRFFEGEAKAAYIQTISPVLSTFPASQVTEIFAPIGGGTSSKPSLVGAQDVPCDIAKGQYLLQYDGEPEKNRCFDRNDPEFKSRFFDWNIVDAKAYAVPGTNWQNVDYDSFNVMVLTYSTGYKEFFMLDQVGNFHYASSAHATLDYTYIKSKSGMIYPVYRGQLYLNEVTSPNIIKLKNGLPFQVKELKDLYQLLQIGGILTMNMAQYGAAAGTFETAIKAWVRRGPAMLPGRPLPGIGVKTTSKGETSTGVPLPVAEETTARMTQAEQEAAGGERVGDFRIVGTKPGLQGTNFVRNISGIYNVQGKQTDIRPIRQLTANLMQEAKAAGARNLVINGTQIRNDNILRMGGAVKAMGGTFNSGGSTADASAWVQIVIPVQ